LWVPLGLVEFLTRFGVELNVEPSHVSLTWNDKTTSVLGVQDSSENPFVREVGFKHSVDDTPMEVCSNTFEFYWKGFSNHAVSSITPDQESGGYNLVGVVLSPSRNMTTDGMGHLWSSIFIEGIRRQSSWPFHKDIMAGEVTNEHLLNFCLGHNVQTTVASFIYVSVVTFNEDALFPILVDDGVVDAWTKRCDFVD
jgi:hypothetical protein